MQASDGAQGGSSGPRDDAIVEYCGDFLVHQLCGVEYSYLHTMCGSIKVVLDISRYSAAACVNVPWGVEKCRCRGIAPVSLVSLSFLLGDLRSDATTKLGESYPPDPRKVEQSMSICSYVRKVGYCRPKLSLSNGVG